MEEWKKFELIPWLVCLLVTLFIQLLTPGKPKWDLWILIGVAGAIVFISRKIQKDKEKPK